MSGYSYSSRSSYAEPGYSEYVSNPVSVISYGVDGARRYVTRVEERIQEVRRPTVTGYSYSSAVKLVPAKDSRPPELDGFITQILNEVNGPSISTTRSISRPVWDLHDSLAMVDQKNGYGADQMFGPSSLGKVNPRRDYGSDYIHSGSPVKTEFPSDYGDRYSQWGRSFDRVYDQPSQRDSGIPNEQWDNPRKKPNEAADYGVPKRDSIVKPHNTGEKFGVPNNKWNNTTIKPQSPKGYEDPNKQWVKSFDRVYDQPFQRDGGVPNEQWDNHRKKPIEAVDYAVPKRDSIVKPHNTGEQFGVPSNKWNNTTIKPQSPKGYEDPNKQWVRSFDRVHDQPFQRDSSVPNEQWDNHRKKPNDAVDYGVPKSDSIVKPQSVKEQFGAPNNKWDHTSTKPQSLMGYEDPNNHGINKATKSPLPNDYEEPNKPWVRTYDRVYDQPFQRDNGSPNEQWDNHRWKPYEVVDYEVPKSDSIVKPQSAKDNFGIPKTRWDNTSIRPQSPKSYDDLNSHNINKPTKSPSSKGYEDTKKQWVGSSDRVHDQPTKSPSSKGYEDPNKQWIRSPDRVYNQSSRRDNDIPNEKWDNHRKKPDEVVDYIVPQRDSIIKSEGMKDQFGVPNNTWNTTTIKPQSPKGYEDPKAPQINTPMGYEDPNNQRVRSSSRVHDQPPQRNYGVPEKPWDNHSKKPDIATSYAAPRVDSTMKPESMKDQPGAHKNGRENGSTEPRSPMGYEAPRSQKGKLSNNPNYDQLSPNDETKGAPNNGWGNSPIKPQDPNIQENISSKPFYDQQSTNSKSNISLNHKSPMGNSSNMKPQSPNHSGDHDNRFARPSSPMSPKFSSSEGSNDKWSNSPLKPQSLRGYGAPEPQWEQPSSPIGDPRPPMVVDVDVDVPNGNIRSQGQPNMSHKETNEYEPREKGGFGESKMFAAMTSPEGAVVSYEKPVGFANVRLRKYFDREDEKSTITCKDAMHKYNGFMI